MTICHPLGYHHCKAMFVRMGCCTAICRRYVQWVHRVGCKVPQGLGLNRGYRAGVFAGMGMVLDSHTLGYTVPFLTVLRVLPRCMRWQVCSERSTSCMHIESSSTDIQSISCNIMIRNLLQPHIHSCHHMELACQTIKLGQTCTLTAFYCIS